MDIALHPRSPRTSGSTSRTTSRAASGTDADGKDFPVASNSILRGSGTARRSTDVSDIFVSDDVDMEMSRIAFGRDGMLYMTIGGPGTGPAGQPRPPAARQRRRRQDPAHDRRRQRAARQPVRRQGRLQAPHLHDGPPHPAGPRAQSRSPARCGPASRGRTAATRSTSCGRAATTAGRSSATAATTAAITCRPAPYRDGMERPHVLWVPSIAVSGMMFYTGDRFPNWQRNLFVGGHARGRDRAHRPAPAHRVQRQLGRTAARSRCCAICTSASATCGRAPTA